MLRPCAGGGASDRPARARPPWHAGQRGGGLVARARMPPFRGGRPLCTARSGTHPRRARSHLYALRCGRGLEPRAPGCGGRGAECREGRSDAECLHRHTHTHTHPRDRAHHAPAATTAAAALPTRPHHSRSRGGRGPGRAPQGNTPHFTSSAGSATSTSAATAWRRNMAAGGRAARVSGGLPALGGGRRRLSRHRQPACVIRLCLQVGFGSWPCRIWCGRL